MKFLAVGKRSAVAKTILCARLHCPPRVLSFCRFWRRVIWARAMAGEGEVRMRRCRAPGPKRPLLAAGPPRVGHFRLSPVSGAGARPPRAARFLPASWGRDSLHLEQPLCRAPVRWSNMMHSAGGHHGHETRSSAITPIRSSNPKGAAILSTRRGRCGSPASRFRIRTTKCPARARRPLHLRRAVRHEDAAAKRSGHILYSHDQRRVPPRGA